jgi:uncharacterized protein YraI
MKLRLLAALGVLVTALAAPVPAAAETVAFAVYDGYSNMRAGPGVRYPIIARIAPGSRVYIIGCLAGYSWCEGVVQGIRGWVASIRLEFLYAGRRVYVPDYYSYWDAPIITFGGYYYDDHPNYDPDRPRWRPRRGWNPPDDDDDHGWRPRWRPGDPRDNEPDIVERPGGGSGPIWEVPGGGGDGGGRPRPGRPGGTDGPVFEAPGGGGGGGGGRPRPGGGACPPGVVCE